MEASPELAAAYTFRWLALASVTGCLGISAWYRYRARRAGETIARTSEPPLLLAGRALIALPLFLAVLAWLANPRWMAWAELPFPGWLRWVGVVLGLLAVPAAYWVFSTIGPNVSETILTKRRHALVTTGPYRWIRHPLYATGVALLLGVSLMAANGFMLAFALATLVGVWLVVIPLEERALLAQFGDAYAGYMRRTGRLLPRL